MEVAQAFQVILMIYVGLAWAQSWVLKLKSLGLCWAATWELGVTEAPSRTRFIALSTIFIEIFSRNMERRRPGQVSKVCKKWVSLKATCSEEKKLYQKSSWAFFEIFSHFSMDFDFEQLYRERYPKGSWWRYQRWQGAFLKASMNIRCVPTFEQLNWTDSRKPT